MYATKQRIYTKFDKTQKSMLCTFLRSFVKQNLELTTDKILDEFVEEQTYYLKINSSRYPFLEDNLEDYEFIKDTKDYINACKRYYNYKQTQAPIIAKQKEFEKKKRKFLQEVKMSKEAPTKKQLYYYERLCKKYNIEKKDINELSKLDMRNEIDKIINEHSGNCINTYE
ncbi:MAG: hypothetical protein NC200_07115 [Candidatus Gastranaerophilales bacterium]|nr:hypothetical protein [Candidatus Gastranaerophilales bacterium]